jgi:DNA polymerase-3 subunit gamma/tau
LAKISRTEKPLEKSLHLKYRPQKFQDVFQPHITKVLNNSIKYNRIPPAIIFAGGTGTGKTTLARIYAMVMNCTNIKVSEDGYYEPCENCISCKSISSANNQSDVLEINASEKTGINDIRNLIDTTYTLPAMIGKYRVFILDEAHKMSDSAQNALLKPLEEPPPHVKFIICTTEADRIIDTIQNRSHIHTFKAVSYQKLLDNLIYICEQEKWKYEIEALENIVLISDGSPRKSVKMLDQICSESITNEDVQVILRISPKNLSFDIIENVINGKSAYIIRLVDSLNAEGKNLQIVYKNLVNTFMDIIKCKVGVQLNYPPEILEKIKNFGTNITATDIFKSISVLKDIGTSMDYRHIPDETVLITGLIELSKRLEKK